MFPSAQFGALAPAGREAAQIADLFWWMTAGALLVWMATLGLAFWAARAEGGPKREGQAYRLIVGGAIVPAFVLCGLLIYGLAMLPPMLAKAPESALRISVYGEQWWWRIRYEPPGRAPFEVANEIHLPAEEPVELLLYSTNVVHSFWIPELGGKMDMIPGRVNRLVLHPEKPGSYRGLCAEFCGRGHARMAFRTVVESRASFDSWLNAQVRP